ncbi:MAG: BamA/TamA family outer membrane protein, partial [Candidatus Cloacimonadaceae bacterium]
LSSDRGLSLKQLPGIMNKILNLYTERSYLFAEVALDTLITDENRLAAVVRITEGPLFRAEKYLFTGNKVTKSATLLRISGLTQVRQITPDILAQAEEKLLRKPYIRDGSIVPINENTLGIAIEETRMTKIEGVLGLTTNPASQKRNLTGLVNLQFLNLWGTDRAIALYWRSLSSSYRLLEMTYHESGWNRYPVEADLMFQRTQQDSAWVRIKAELSAYYSLLEHKFGTVLATENLYPDHPDSLVAIKTSYYTSSLFWEFAKTDYAPNPKSGSRLKIKYGLQLNNTAERTKTVPVTEIDAAAYIPLYERFVFAPALHFREISDQNARVYEQYKLGGFSSLRGFNEDAFSSWRIGWSNSELRYLMSRDSRLFLLFDNGFLQIAPDKIKTDLMAAGAGISVQTRVGLISVSYALSIINGKLTEPASGLLHVGLVTSF